jgi:hypothetical protein
LTELAAGSVLTEAVTVVFGFIAVSSPTVKSAIRRTNTVPPIIYFVFFVKDFFEGFDTKKGDGVVSSFLVSSIVPRFIIVYPFMLCLLVLSPCPPVM